MMIYISGMATFGVATRNMRAVSPRVCFIGLTLLSVGRISTSLAQVMSLNLPRRARLPRESFREVVPGSIEESQREAALLLREIILGRALNDEDKITGIELANFCADFERAAACVDIESCEITITLSKPEGTNRELESAAIKELFEPAFSARWMTARADEDDETERISMLSNADHVRAFLLAQPVEWSATVRDLHASRPEDGPFRAEMTKISTSTVLVKIVNEAHEAQTRRELLDEIAELQLAVAERERRLAESIQQHQVDLADVTNTARAELQAAHEDAQEARGLAERELSRFRAMLRLAESKLEMATMRERIALTAGQSARRNAEEEVLAARLEQERARNEAQTARELLTRIVQEPRAHALESAGINSAAGVWEVIMSSFQPLPFSCTRALLERERNEAVTRWAMGRAARAQLDRPARRDAYGHEPDELAAAAAAWLGLAQDPQVYDQGIRSYNAEQQARATALARAYRDRAAGCIQRLVVGHARHRLYRKYHMAVYISSRCRLPRSLISYIVEFAVNARPRRAPGC